MEQLIFHLFGDYFMQTDWMARKKTSESWVACLHAFIYSLPFIFLTSSLTALFVIFASHFVIDRYRLARHVTYAKNWVTQPSLCWSNCSTTGFPSTTPPWMAVWLLIIVDNTMHIAINYASIRWL